MNFEVLCCCVKCVEQVVLIWVDEIQCNWFIFSQVWCVGWILLCIIIVGFVGGFLVGKLELGIVKFYGVWWLQMIGLVFNLMVSVQVVFVLMQVSEVVDIVEQVVDKVDEVVDDVVVFVVVMCFMLFLLVLLCLVVVLFQ